MKFFGRKNWEEELSAYLDGELWEGEREQLEALLRKKPELRARLEELRALKKLFSLPSYEGRARDLWPGVRARILAESKSRGLLPGRDSLWLLLPRLGGRLVPAVCALLLVASVALVALHPGTRGEEPLLLASASPLSLNEEEIFLGGGEAPSPESVIQFIVAPSTGEELP